MKQGETQTTKSDETKTTARTDSRTAGSTRMPALFVGHGSPMNAIEDTVFSAEWDRIAQALPHPKAILSISAHWYTDGLFVNDSKTPRQVYDMYGFPQALYDVKYPAPGSPELAHRIIELLGAGAAGTNAVAGADAAQKTAAGLEVTVDNSWGLDHGTWSILHRMFPKADVPIVQLSVDAGLSAKEHLELGRKLSVLRDEGVMIFGSGDVVHNLGLVDWSMTKGYPWAEEFDGWIKDRVVARDFASAIDWKRAGDCARKAFSTPEHFYPLLYVLGASSDADELEIFCDSCELGAISMTGYWFK